VVSRWPVEINMPGQYIVWNDGTQLSWAGIGGGQLRNQTRLNQIAAHIQATYLDKVTPEAAFGPEDQYRASTDAELAARYGGRVFRDGNGNIVERDMTISLSWEDATQRIVPACAEVL